MFPNLSASVVFNRWMTQDFNLAPVCWGGSLDVNHPFSPVNLAFNSRDELVIGNDGYYANPTERANRQLYLYRTPLTKQTPDAVITVPVGAVGDLAFDQGDRLVVQDHTWYRVWGDRPRGAGAGRELPLDAGAALSGRHQSAATG